MLGKGPQFTPLGLKFLFDSLKGFWKMVENVKIEKKKVYRNLLGTLKVSLAKFDHSMYLT